MAAPLLTNWQDYWVGTTVLQLLSVGAEYHGIQEHMEGMPTATTLFSIFNAWNAPSSEVSQMEQSLERQTSGGKH